MPRPKPPTDTPPEHHWVCEGCDAVHVGVDPPDYCNVCDHPYFENMADTIAEWDRLH